MQKLNYEPIPKESLSFIIIGSPTPNHPDVNTELLQKTSDDIEFLKSQLKIYIDKSGPNESLLKSKKSDSNIRFSSEIRKPPIQTPDTPKLRESRSPKSVSIYDRQRKPIVPKKTKKKIRSNTANNSSNYIIYERTPEYLFIKKFGKTITKDKLTQYQQICAELSSQLSTIIHFVEIHFQQKIPISIERKQFQIYCDSFFHKEGSLYLQLGQKEERLSNKLQELSQLTKYKIVDIDQLRSELVKILNFEYENDENKPTSKKKKKKDDKRRKKKKNENNDQKSENKNNDHKNGEKGEIQQPFFISNLDYAPYSTIDDLLFYYIHSNNVYNSNNQFRDSPDIEIQKIALEITGIAERNLSFKPNKNTNEEANPNYSLFNSYLDQLFTLILSDESIFDQIKDKEKMTKIYQHQIKTVITIAFTRIIFDAAYLFNYDYLLSDVMDENNHHYLHFNQEDVSIEINSKVIQNLLPRDLDIPDGFLIDYSMHKSHSQQNLQSQSQAEPNNILDSDSDSDSYSFSEGVESNIQLNALNSSSSFCSFIPIKGSYKTINALMSREEDFLIMSEKLQDLQFYSNPFDLAYIINLIFTRIQTRLSKIHQMTSSRVKNTDSIHRESGIPRSRSREFDPFVQFDDLFLFFLTVFTFNPPKNSRWIAAMLKRFSKLVPNMPMQQSASFFIAAVNYTSTFPMNEEFSPELMNHIQQLKNEFSNQNH